MRKNKFDKSHEHDTTVDMGSIIPILVDEVMPGQEIKLKTEMFVRVSPMLAPVMTRMSVRTYNFFVPMRLIWDDAEEFFTRGRNQDSTVTVPRLRIGLSSKGNFYANRLPNYMGIPAMTAGTAVSGYHYISALPFRAYWEVINEFFTDLEVQDMVEFSKSSDDITDDGFDSEMDKLTRLAYRNWDKDYFTAAKTSAGLNTELTGMVTVQPQSSAIPGYEVYKGQTRVVRSDTGGVPGGAMTLDAEGDVLLGGNPVRFENLEELLPYYPGFDPV